MTSVAIYKGTSPPPALKEGRVMTRKRIYTKLKEIIIYNTKFPIKIEIKVSGKKKEKKS